VAVIFKLYDGTNTIDFTSATDFHLLQGFHPEEASPTGDGSIPPDVTQIVPIIVDCTSDDDLATTKQKFHAMQLLVARYMLDPIHSTPLWWHHKLDGETGELRHLVKSLAFQWTEPAGGIFDAQPLITEGRRAVVTFIHHPYGEHPTGRNFPTASPSAAAAITYDYTAAGSGGTPAAHDIVGDVGARVGTFIFYSAAAGADVVDRLWMGFRSAGKYGQTLANFDPIWECEDGTNNANESGIVDGADANASGGNKVTVTETDLDWDDTWHEVLELVIDDVSANESDQYGVYLWLLRALVSAGTWEVQLRWGYSGMPDADHAQGRIVSVSATSYDMHEMGVFQLPIRDLKVFSTTAITDAADDDMGLQLWAQRTSGAGTLTLDCLCLIPIDEGYLVASDLDIAAAETGYFGYSPMDTHQILHVGAAAIEHIPSVDVHNFNLPLGDGRIVAVYARSLSHDLTDVMRFDTGEAGEYFERWLSLRGSE
jgi:hypothetical protein